MGKKVTGVVAGLVVGVALGGYFLGPMVLQGQAPQAERLTNVAKNEASTVLAKELTSYRDVVKKILPAVVSIEAKRESAADQRVPNIRTPQIPEEFRRFFKELPREFSTPQVPNRPSVGFGSGVIVQADGVILTNFHVVRGAKKATVQLLDGSKFVSTYIRGDRKTDLAILKIDTKGRKLPILTFGDSEKMEIGDRVLAVGAPFGLRGSVTHGIVSAKGRNGLQMNMYEDFIQTDAAINPGNSGGPLVNLEGKIIGINAAIKSRSGGFNGVGLAVASNLAKIVKNALLKDGVVRRGYLGVQITALEPQVADRLGLERNLGVIVNKVYEKAPGDKGGIKPGDVLVRMNEKEIRSARDLQLKVAAAPLNKESKFEILREGKRQTLSVTIEEQPEEYDLAPGTPKENPTTEPEGTSLDQIGTSVADLTPQLAKRFGLNANDQGVVITNIVDGSLAAGAGLQMGMLIVQIDNTPLSSVKQAQEILAKASLARGVLLQIRSAEGGTSYVLLQSKTN